jgi:N-acetylneuraminic acid mutarotase
MIDRRTLVASAGAALAPVAAAAAGRWGPCAAVPWPVQEVYGAAWNGKAVIAGGLAPTFAGERMIFNPLDRTAVYDPAADRWSEGPRLPFARHHPVLASAGGQIYAFGGFRVTEPGEWVAIPDAVVMAQEGWRALAPMPGLQCETVAVTLGERIHIASGRAPRGIANGAYPDHADVDLHQVFEPGAGKWTTARPCPLARNSATGGAIDGLFYLAGGRRVGAGNSAQLDRYDPKTDRWETLRPMPRAAGGLGGAAAGGKLYVVGGEGGPGVIPNVWSYDPKTDAWTAEPAMRTPRHGLAGVAVNGRVYALGGGVKEGGGEVSAIAEVLIPG